MPEETLWQLKADRAYYVPVYGSGLVAFRTGRDIRRHLRLSAAHTDFPALRIKQRPEIREKGYLKLNAETYGGLIRESWLDRPLSLAGAVALESDDPFRPKLRLIDLEKPVLTIPRLAIHMNRSVNEGAAFNNQVDMLPLFSAGACREGSFRELVAGELGVNAGDILGCDLGLYSRTAPSVWGAKEEFISSARLDDLQCAFTSAKAMIAAENAHSVNVFACFDNEEVGSGTKQGACSTFLRDVLTRINDGLGFSGEDYCRAVAKSFMVSCDNAHAVHPNHPEKTDETNCTYLNKGIVIKYAANQKYTTDGVSAAVFKAVCERAGVPYQVFANRSDMAGGSILGNLSSQKVSLHTVDIGIPQLAMHSSYETAGVMDTLYMIQALTKFYEMNIVADGEGVRM